MVQDANFLKNLLWGFSYDIFQKVPDRRNLFQLYQEIQKVWIPTCWGHFGATHFTLRYEEPVKTPPDKDK